MLANYMKSSDYRIITTMLKCFSVMHVRFLRSSSKSFKAIDSKKVQSPIKISNKIANSFVDDIINDIKKNNESVTNDNLNKGEPSLDNLTPPQDTISEKWNWVPPNKSKKIDNRVVQNDDDDVIPIIQGFVVLFPPSNI